jgi:uncharacterized membrane protein
MEFLNTLWVIAAAILAGRAYFRTRALAANVVALDARIAGLELRLSGLDSQPTTAPEAPPVEAPLPEQPVSALEPVAATEEALSGRPIASGKSWEEVLVENWLVWLGGLALALGGAFLVKLSIDYGLLTPVVRIVLGVLLGIGLWAGAEWVVWGEPAEIRPSNVAQALAAAGAATIFASLFAAYQLYGLLPPALAFPLLALTSAATVLMSLQHGPFVAVLGLTGAFAVPLLVGSDEPLALPLFAYLTLVNAASLALLRHRAWWWLAWVSVAASIGWALLWLATSYRHEDFFVIGGYLLAQLGLFAALRRGIAWAPFIEGVIDEPMVRVLVRTAFWAISFAAFVLVNLDFHGTAALGCAFLDVLSLLWFAYRDSELTDVIAAAGALAAALLASWTLPVSVDQRTGFLHTIPPEQVSRFITVAIAFAVLLGAGGFLALPRVPRPSRWAALSAASPPIILAISYWRIEAFGLDIAWTFVAIALAGLELAAADWAAKRRDGTVENETVLAAYAVGVLGCTILAAVFALEDAWLTVALALHLPALAWIEGRVGLPVLRHLAFVVAAAVLVRLALNPEVLRYPLSDTLIFNWLLYGYGVPAAAFIIATRQFGSRTDDLLVRVLEAGSVVFSVLLATLELWHALSERPLRFALDNFELNAMETAAWLAMAAWLLHLGRRRGRAVLSWSGIVLFGCATLFAVGWQAIIISPLTPFLGQPVEGGFLFDSLLLAYALPALLYALIGVYRLGPRAVWQAAQVLAVGFAFLWVTLEIRHVFQGERLNQGSTSEAEWYAYSAAWLAFAAAGLGAALKWRNLWLRRVSLLGIGLVVGKVFLSDMADLSGALRALSFIGLGAVLVGIGYAYRRLRPLEQE